MALPNVYLNSVESYNEEDGVVAYYLYFEMDPYDEDLCASVFRGGEYVESGDLECYSSGVCRIDSYSEVGVQVSVRVVVYVGAGASRRESFSRAIIFTPVFP